MLYNYPPCFQHPSLRLLNQLSCCHLTIYTLWVRLQLVNENLTTQWTTYVMNNCAIPGVYFLPISYVHLFITFTHDCSWSITPMMYPATFWFNEPSTAYICLIVINLFIGITCIITSFLLEMFEKNDKVWTLISHIFTSFKIYQ